jgi:hypothetical protein
VPDLPAFLNHIRPVLDERLAASEVVRAYSGSLRLNFYRSGVRFDFEKGKITAIEPWSSSDTEGGDAGFPGLTFLHPLFGYRTASEVWESFPDCWIRTDAAQALLMALFPKRPSDVWPLS